MGAEHRVRSAVSMAVDALEGRPPALGVAAVSVRPRTRRYESERTRSSGTAPKGPSAQSHLLQDGQAQERCPGTGSGCRVGPSVLRQCRTCVLCWPSAGRRGRRRRRGARDRPAMEAAMHPSAGDCSLSGFEPEDDVQGAQITGSCGGASAPRPVDLQCRTTAVSGRRAAGAASHGRSRRAAARQVCAEGAHLPALRGAHRATLSGRTTRSASASR